MPYLSLQYLRTSLHCRGGGLTFLWRIVVAFFVPFPARKLAAHSLRCSSSPHKAFRLYGDPKTKETFYERGHLVLSDSVPLAAIVLLMAKRYAVLNHRPIRRCFIHLYATNHNKVHQYIQVMQQPSQLPGGELLELSSD